MSSIRPQARDHTASSSDGQVVTASLDHDKLVALLAVKNDDVLFSHDECFVMRGRYVGGSRSDQ